MKPSEVKVECRKCKKKVLAESFVLDHVYRMMVCPQCAKDRTRKADDKDNHSKTGLDIQPHIKPSDWDDDDRRINDEYLKKKARSPFRSGEKIDVKCTGCHYSFKYDTAKRYPKLCPGCGTKIKIESY